MRLHECFWFCLTSFLTLLPATGLNGADHVIETAAIRFEIQPDSGAYEIRDKQADVTWKSNPFQRRFGEASIKHAGKTASRSLGRCEVKTGGSDARGLELLFRPLPENQDLMVRVTLRAVQDATLELAWEASPGLEVESIRLLDRALWTSADENGFMVVPVREGLLVPADSKLAFTHRFDTYAYEGCHMAMLGAVKAGAAALVHWPDPYVLAELTSTLTNMPAIQGAQVLAPSLVLRKSAKSFRIQFLGPGDYVSIAQAYRQVAKDRGWVVTWNEKLKGHPERANYFGAANYKLWSALTRRMSEDSSKEESARVNWTFAEAAQIAEHLKHDLKLDKVLFMIGGWIRRGYDNQHPDILPAAPECGGNEALADCARRIRQLGYIFSLHDNYQDIYRDSPSWNEDCIMKNPDGSLAKGGKWAGGRAYLTCSLKALELARRPQNLPAVEALTGADSYFIDTTYAAGLMECFDPRHPLTRWDDMKWKQAISDYAREVFGSFGSECGREWAIPHSDFFEGFTGVSGAWYHNKDLAKNLGATVVPLFEMVYRDCIAMYGKYGYDPAHAAEYVLHHLAIGRPMHYHNIPPHLYWQESRALQESEALPLHPAVAEVKQSGPDTFQIRYRWKVDKTPPRNYRVFVHFTDDAGNIKFQNDYAPATPSSQWQPGTLEEGPFTVQVPEGLRGTFRVWMGLFETPNGSRAPLVDARDGERRQTVGKLVVSERRIAFEPSRAASPPTAGDPAVFTRAENGWAEGLHPLDRFVKNTFEILSPLNELTSRALLTQHTFLTPDRKVQRSVFGTGSGALQVIVNASPSEYRYKSKLGGETVLPPYGFVVESPAFVAFHALSWNGLRYDAPVMFTLRSTDGLPLTKANGIRVFHAFGDARLKLGSRTHTVPCEQVVSMK